MPGPLDETETSRRSSPGETTGQVTGPLEVGSAAPEWFGPSRGTSVVALSNQDETCHLLHAGRVSRTHKYLVALLGLGHVMRGGGPGIEHRDFFLGITHGSSEKL